MGTSEVQFHSVIKIQNSSALTIWCWVINHLLFTGEDCCSQFQHSSIAYSSLHRMKASGAFLCLLGVSIAVLVQLVFLSVMLVRPYECSFWDYWETASWQTPWSSGSYNLCASLNMYFLLPFCSVHPVSILYHLNYLVTIDLSFESQES